MSPRITVATLALALVSYGVAPAAAETPAPTATDVVATPSPTPTGPETPAPTGTATPTETPSPSGTTEAPSPSGTPTGSPSGSPSASTTSAPATPSATATATRVLIPAGALDVRSPRVSADAASSAGYAADFLRKGLAANGHHMVASFGGTSYPDTGNTIDAILALDGTASGQSEAAAATAYVETNVGSYIGKDFGDTYAGPTAKALVGVLAQGKDPKAFGGFDLLALLQGLEQPTGRFSDASAWGDYSSTISQSLAVLALRRAGQPVSTAAVSFLLAQQCADGGFRNSLDAETCVSDPDATAFAAQALLAVGATAPDVRQPAAATALGDAATSAGLALDYLQAKQAASGGLAGAGAPINANTTGVAAQAFAAGGRSPALAKAQAFLLGLQYDCADPAALRGGIAYAATQLSTKTPSDSDYRATPQATLGLAGGWLLTVAAGGSATTVAMPCDVPTATPTPSVTPTPSPTTSPPAGGGSLAYTGADVRVPLGLGLALLVLGGLLVLLGRRRGAYS